MCRADQFIECVNKGVNSIRMQGVLGMAAAEVYRHLDELSRYGHTVIDGKTVTRCPSCGRAIRKGYYCNYCEPQCRWCGKTFVDKSANHSGVFCSERCRQMWINCSPEEKALKKARMGSAWKDLQ